MAHTCWSHTSQAVQAGWPGLASAGAPSVGSNVLGGCATALFRGQQGQIDGGTELDEESIQHSR
jgi:hypothetical protein